MDRCKSNKLTSSNLGILLSRPIIFVNCQYMIQYGNMQTCHFVLMFPSSSTIQPSPVKKNKIKIHNIQNNVSFIEILHPLHSKICCKLWIHPPFTLFFSKYSFEYLFYNIKRIKRIFDLSSFS